VQEKELRIALVCFGGVSLAVYMHGVSKEVLKLVRASRALHAIADRNARSRSGFFDAYDWTDSEYDTEPIYFELLREIGRTIELRVIVDIIAGASAGGINGTMLARGISHDLRMGKLRELWLDNADVAELLAADAKATRWSKWFLRPVFWAAMAARLQAISDHEVRAKLSMFVRSRWFKPPLDGMRMANLMYDAVTAMGTPTSATASLLPSGHDLDLFVTVTDFFGNQELIAIHDPPIIQDREHRHLLRFKYRRNAGGAVTSDFDMANAPALAFAARATSSFPGAFPPAQIAEMDRLVAERGATWPRREAFIAENFEHYIRAERDPVTAPLIDGSVLNNRPFRAAIDAIHGKPAHRQVDRRVVYIDPDPAPQAAPARQGVPSFFSTLKGAMSDIPRAEPVTEELNWIIGFNEQVRRLRAIVDNSRPRISSLVDTVMTGPADQPLTEEQIRLWREQANNRVVRDAGFAYEGYVRLKLVAARAFVSQTIMDIRKVRARTPSARAITEVIDAWAVRAGAVYAPNHANGLTHETAGQAALPRWAQFLLAFDVDYRKRRLHFMIEGQNRLYEIVEASKTRGLEAVAVDSLKRQFYDRLDEVQRRESATRLDPEIRPLVEEIFAEAPSASETRAITAYAAAHAEKHHDKLERLIEALARDVDLDASTRDLDLLLVGVSGWAAEARREVLVNYLGFPFWDVLTFPMMSWRESGEFNEILVDRISPRDARTVNKLGSFPLKGTGFQHFAAFFSRGYRENDYLLGRLHTLDRLFDIVCDAAGLDGNASPQVRALKQRGLLQILSAEAPYLRNSAALIDALRQSITHNGA
jgi:patatin-related protein